MTGSIASRTGIALTAMIAGVALLLAACGGGDDLSRADVEEIVRAELASATAQPTTPPALTSAEVEAIVRAAMADMPQPEQGLTRADVEAIVRATIASTPSKAAPAQYTRHVVRNAIARYEAQGLDAAQAYYNSPQSVDGQWYVFIVDGDGMVIAHPDPGRLGLDVKGWVGADLNGYHFGTEMLTATEDGKWVSYVYRNPESGGIGTGDFELKNVWAERRDGLLFASGWYINANAFTEKLVGIAVDNFRAGGLPGTMAYFASPGDALAGLEAAVDYYNSADTVEGHWFAFIGDPNGVVVAHSDPAVIGQETVTLIGVIPMEITGDGLWIASDSLRVHVAAHDGFIFGSGWSRDE